MRTDDRWIHKTEVQKIQQRVSRIIPDFPKDPREDRALITAYKNGSQEAGRALIENYLDIISIIYCKPSNPPKMRKPDGQRFIIRPPSPNIHDKEDILQEILLQFFGLVEEYDESFGLPFFALIKGKLFLRFHNKYYREFFDIKAKECEYDEEFELPYSSPEDLYEDDKAPKGSAKHIELYEAMNKLTKRQREVLELSIVKGWTSNVVAQELGSSPEAVRKAKERALDKLKTLMGAG